MAIEEEDYGRALERLEKHQTFEIAWCAAKLREFMGWDSEPGHLTLRPAEVVDVVLPLAQAVAHLLDLAEQRPRNNLDGAAGMGARLVERAMGPSLDELVEVLSATQHALDVERGRVERLARTALGLIGELPPDLADTHADLARELVQLVARQRAEDETSDLMGGP